MLYVRSYEFFNWNKWLFATCINSQAQVSTKVDCNIHHKHKHISGLLFTCFDFSFVWFRRKLCSTMFCRLFMLIRLSKISRNQKVVELQYHQCLPHFYCNYCHAFMFIKGFNWKLYCTVMINKEYYISHIYCSIYYTIIYNWCNLTYPVRKLPPSTFHMLSLKLQPFAIAF